MVDTVISLEGDRQQLFRLLRVLKNRFGPNQEMLIFQMMEQGLELRKTRPPTSRRAGRRVIRHGRGHGRGRPEASGREVQAPGDQELPCHPQAHRARFDVNRLHLLLAVLEKRLHLSFAQVDIYAKWWAEACA